MKPRNVNRLVKIARIKCGKRIGPGDSEVALYMEISTFCRPEPSDRAWVSERHRVTLKYRSRRYGADWASVKQQFPVVWTPCRFGGERPWFTCSVYANGTYCGRAVPSWPFVRLSSLFSARLREPAGIRPR